MTPYVPGKPIEEVKRELGLDHVVKLASNENPLGPSPLAVAAVREASAQMHLYPDASGFALKTKLAAKHGLALNNVVLGNGSDELIHLLGLVFLQPGDQMVVAEPTFVRYAAAAQLAGVELLKVPLDSGLRHDLAAMRGALTSQTKLVFVANPHNPTGTVVAEAELDQLVDALPENCTLVLDEAYIEYAGGDGGVQYVRDGKRVVVLRTFSKAYGLAGIRVGYGFASGDLTDAIDRAREPFDVNSLAQVAACAALDDQAHLNASVKLNQEGLFRLSHIVQSHGFRAVPSHANFLCVDLGRPGLPVFHALMEQGVVVRPGEPLGLPGHIRVSVGTVEQLDAFERALALVLSPA